MNALGSAVLLALASLAQEQRSPTPPPPALERVVVLGASVSAGFGLDRDLARALEVSIAAVHEPVRSVADALLFLNPLQTGPRLLEQTLEAEPTLVVALDYLFWFGYGTINAQGGPLASEEERLGLLERGLEGLEALECPLILGDFPDMSASVGKMLAPEQMPEAGTLERLSRRVREWAQEREHTLVLPLSELVRALGSKEKVVIGRHEFPPGSQLLQGDQLHPTLQGMVAGAQLVADELVKHGLSEEGDFNWDFTAVLMMVKAKPARGVRVAPK